MSPPRRQRYTNGRKLRIIADADKRIEGGESINSICRSYKIQPNQLHNWREKKIALITSKASGRGLFTPVKRSCLRDIEDQLIQWFFECHNAGIPMSMKTLCGKAGEWDAEFGKKSESAQYQAMRRLCQTRGISLKKGVLHYKPPKKRSPTKKVREALIAAKAEKAAKEAASANPTSDDGFAPIATAAAVAAVEAVSDTPMVPVMSKSTTPMTLRSRVKRELEDGKKPAALGLAEANAKAKADEKGKAAKSAPRSKRPAAKSTKLAPPKVVTRLVAPKATEPVPKHDAAAIAAAAANYKKSITESKAQPGPFVEQQVGTQPPATVFMSATVPAPAPGLIQTIAPTTIGTTIFNTPGMSMFSTNTGTSAAASASAPTTSGTDMMRFNMMQRTEDE